MCPIMEHDLYGICRKQHHSGGRTSDEQGRAVEKKLQGGPIQEALLAVIHIHSINIILRKFSRASAHML